MADTARRPPGNALEETGRLPIMFAGQSTGPGLVAECPGSASGVLPASGPGEPAEPDYERIQRSAEFVSLRSRLRRFVFPVTVLFVVWYLAFVVLAAYAHEFMSIKVFGEVNVAILLGLGQFASTAIITVAYVRYARRRIDPQVASIRREAGVPEQ